jgi:hypothetical protein
MKDETKSDFKVVKKKELDKFLADYPNKLVFDIYHVPDPPVGTWNDFTTGLVWPESIVAMVHFDRAGRPTGYKIWKASIAEAKEEEG